MKRHFSAVKTSLAVLAAMTCGLTGLAQGTTASPAAAPIVVNSPALPYGASEVVKLHQNGIDKDTIVKFIDSTALPYHLNADQIISLQKMGIPNDLTSAMIQRDGWLQQQAAQQQFYQQQSAPPPNYGAEPPPAAEQSPVVTPTTPAPDVTVIGSSYPAYDYGYDYGWPYYSGYGYWPVGWGWGWNGRGWGWGRGRGWGGFRGGGYHGGFGGYHGSGGFHGGFSGGFHGGGGGFHSGGGFGGGHGGGHR
jgi:hypothetical protein